MVYYTTNLDHLVFSLDTIDSAVKAALDIRQIYNENAIQPHRLSLYIDEAVQYSFQHCGVSELFYKEHRQTYALSSHRPKFWHCPNPIYANVFCNDMLLNEISSEIRSTLKFIKISKSVVGLFKPDFCRPTKDGPTVTDNIVLSPQINMIQSVNAVKCFSRLLSERQSQNRPRVCAQMWSDISHLYWRSVGILVVRCIDDDDDAYNKCYRWDQPVTPKSLQKQVNIAYYNNNLDHLLHEEKIEIEEAITTVCDTLCSGIQFDDTFNQLINQRNSLHNQSETSIDNNNIFPNIVKIQPGNTSLVQPLRVCVSQKVSHLVDFAFDLLKSNGQEFPKNMKSIKCYLSWGSALVTDEADFLIGPVVDRMNNMFRYKPRRVEDIAEFNSKLQQNGLIIDKYAEQAIKHEKKVLPHTNWMLLPSV